MPAHYTTALQAIFFFLIPKFTTTLSSGYVPINFRKASPLLEFFVINCSKKSESTLHGQCIVKCLQRALSGFCITNHRASSYHVGVCCIGFTFSAFFFFFFYSSVTK